MVNQDSQNLFHEIIEAHKGILLKVVRAYCQNEADRQDLMQEIMIQVWQSISKFNHQSKVSTWLYRISLNVAITFYRKNTVRSNIQDLKEIEVQNNIEDKSATEQQLNLLELFINELKDIDKALMVLYLEDKSHAEIAEILGMSVSNVGTKINRIKEKLKTRFSNLK